MKKKTKDLVAYKKENLLNYIHNYIYITHRYKDYNIFIINKKKS